MATKEQELKALEQIRKIVEDLGEEGSYIAAAFDGCFELAESNIRNDALGSWKEACVSRSTETEKLRKSLIAIITIVDDMWRKEAERKYEVSEECFSLLGDSLLGDSNAKTRLESLTQESEILTANTNALHKIYWELSQLIDKT